MTKMYAIEFEQFLKSKMYTNISMEDVNTFQDFCSDILEDDSLFDIVVVLAQKYKHVFDTFNHLIQHQASKDGLGDKTEQQKKSTEDSPIAAPPAPALGLPPRKKKQDFFSDLKRYESSQNIKNIILDTTKDIPKDIKKDIPNPNQKPDKTQTKSVNKSDSITTELTRLGVLPTFIQKNRIKITEILKNDQADQANEFIKKFFNFEIKDDVNTIEVFKTIFKYLTDNKIVITIDDYPNIYLAVQSFIDNKSDYDMFFEAYSAFETKSMFEETITRLRQMNVILTYVTSENCKHVLLIMAVIAKVIQQESIIKNFNFTTSKISSIQTNKKHIQKILVEVILRSEYYYLLPLPRVNLRLVENDEISSRKSGLSALIGVYQELKKDTERNLYEDQLTTINDAWDSINTQCKKIRDTFHTDTSENKETINAVINFITGINNDHDTLLESSGKIFVGVVPKETKETIAFFKYENWFLKLSPDNLNKERFEVKVSLNTSVKCKSNNIGSMTVALHIKALNAIDINTTDEFVKVLHTLPDTFTSQQIKTMKAALESKADIAEYSDKWKGFDGLTTNDAKILHYCDKSLNLQKYEDMVKMLQNFDNVVRMIALNDGLFSDLCTVLLFVMNMINKTTTRTFNLAQLHLLSSYNIKNKKSSLNNFIKEYFNRNHHLIKLTNKENYIATPAFDDTKHTKINFIDSIVSITDFGKCYDYIASYKAQNKEQKVNDKVEELSKTNANNDHFMKKLAEYKTAKLDFINQVGKIQTAAKKYNNYGSTYMLHNTTPLQKISIFSLFVDRVGADGLSKTNIVNILQSIKDFCIDFFDIKK